MEEDIFKYRHKSYIEIGKVFFWTATINQWHRLLGEDIYKDVIIDSLEYLSNAGKIDVLVRETRTTAAEVLMVQRRAG